MNLPGAKCVRSTLAAFPSATSSETTFPLIGAQRIPQQSVSYTHLTLPTNR